MNPFARIPQVLALGLAALFFVGATQLDKAVTVEAQNVHERVQQQTVTVKTLFGSGTGVVVKANGHVFIWTAAHVVAGCQDITITKVKIVNGREVGHYTANVALLAFSLREDIAILTCDDLDFFRSSASFDLSGKLPTVGESVIHVGSFYGPGGEESVSTGIISFVGREVSGQYYDQFSAAATPGSSGGGVFRAETGKFIGLVVMQRNVNFTLMIPVRKLVDFARERAHLEWTGQLN